MKGKSRSRDPPNGALPVSQLHKHMYLDRHSFNCKLLNEPLCEPCISRHARPFRLLGWTQVQRHTANVQRAKQFASCDLAVSEDF